MNLQEKSRALLKKHYGYDSFRPMQQEIIDTVLAKKDALVLMPTGGGKSLCFQLPALVMDGVGLVVSPLIALMKDQVEALKANGIPAAYLNSSQNSDEQREIDHLVRSGQIKLLYVSPEKILSGNFIAYLQQMPINLIAIDEAHCISSWGHDFRPEYAQLYRLKRAFPGLPVIALTATADKLTRKDIAERMELKDPTVFIASFDRPNLNLRVLPGRERVPYLIDFVRQRPGQSGIVYCLSKKNTEALAAKLNQFGIKAAYYHAGMGTEERARTQEDFIRDRVPIVCATIAFGMGIDKSNVRWVMHYNMPKNIEGYYQEIGRAGRDGLPSDTVLFYSYGDVVMLRKFIEDSGQKEVQNAKLDRMIDYADALTCRRRVLLNYFNENLPENCGNCDVCENPPQRFDGTIPAQKVLSVVARTNEKATMNEVALILRGAQRKELIEKGFDKIKTYGAGKDILFEDWLYFLMQMLHIGLVEVAYDEHSALKLTPYGKEVLFHGKHVELARTSELKKKEIEREEQVAEKAPSKKVVLGKELFERLKALRKQIAEADGVPPYVVFNDATLAEMAEAKPDNEGRMRQISGVGEHKLAKYGPIFLQAIVGFITEKTEEGNATLKGGTFLLTHKMILEGLSIEEISKKRELKDVTVYSHLAHLYEHGYEGVDIARYIDPQQLARVRQALEGMEELPTTLKPLFDSFKEEIPYHVIRLSISLIKKEKMAVS